MREAVVEGRIVIAGPDSPDRAHCPRCGAPVAKRKRSRMDGRVTYFYRHERGQGEACSLRYNPTADR